MSMEFSGEERPWKFVDRETRNINVPTEFSFDGNEDDPQLTYARTSCASAAAFPVCPMSPEFVDGETRNINAPTEFSFDGNEDDPQLTSARTSCASAAAFPVCPMSPEFVDGETRNINAPIEFSFDGNENDPQLTSARTFCASAAAFPVCPMSPEFVDGETRNINAPTEFSFDGNEDDPQLTSARTSCASAASFPVCPMSPETPWTRSPIHGAASPAPPLLYDCLASLHRSEGNIFSMTVTKDFLFTGSSSRRIHAWKQPDCTEMGYIRATSGEIRAMLAAGKLLFTAHGDCRIRAWEMSPTETFRPKKMMTLPRRRSIFFSYPKKNNDQHKDSISCLAYNNREKLLFTGSFDQTVKVWKIQEKRCIDSFLAHEGRVNAIVINPEDGCVFTCSSDGTVKKWRRVSRESTHILMMILKFQPSPINAMALSLSPGVCVLYSGSSDGLINFWKKERISGRYSHGGFLQGHHFAVLCLVTIEDLILSGSEDATIRIWKREQCNPYHSSLAVIDGHHGPVKCLAATLEINESDKGLLVYSASLDQTLKVWRVKVYPEENVGWDRSEDINDQHLERNY